MTEVLQVEGIAKVYGETPALHDLTFGLEEGKILGLVGPNGAGKTTTLEILSGILPPTEGAVRVCGQDLATQPAEAKRHLAYVPDMPQPFDHLTVEEHLRFVGALYGVSGFEGRIDGLLEEYELEEKRRSLATELSRGMKQKLALCCALLHSPRVLLLDEPHAGLDPRARRTLTSTIRRLGEAGVAVIVSSHFLPLVEELCDSILVLHRGRKRLFGTLEECRGQFPDLRQDANLEEIFFQATEEIRESGR